MRSKLLWPSVFVVAVVLAPTAAFAQQNPVAPDGTSMNEPPAAGAQAASDACGNTPQDAFGQPTPNGLPQQTNNVNPKDMTGVRPVENMSSVTGMVMHVEGDLVWVDGRRVDLLLVQQRVRLAQELVDPLLAGARHGLVGRHDDPLDARGVEDRLERDDQLHR